MKFFNKKYEELGQKTALSKQEKELDKILENYVFYNDKTSKIFLDIQALEHIREFQGSEYGVSDKKYKELKADGFFDGTKLYQKAIEKRVKRDYISLVHEGVFYILQEDMVTIGSLIMICFFALIIPYQLKQRLRQVIPIMATTKTGKKDLSDSIDSKCTCCTLCWNYSNGCIWDYLAFEGIIGIFGDVRVGESHQILTGAISFLLELICYFIWL